MRKLDIGCCNMSAEGAESLARALTVNRSLQELDISENKISDNGMAHIVTALQIDKLIDHASLHQWLHGWLAGCSAGLQVIDSKTTYSQ